MRLHKHAMHETMIKYSEGEKTGVEGSGCSEELNASKYRRVNKTIPKVSNKLENYAVLRIDVLRSEPWVP